MAAVFPRDTVAEMLQADRREFEACLAQGLHRSALILAGSLIQMLLVDVYLSHPRVGTTPEQVAAADLATLLGWADEDGLIAPRTKQAAWVLRDYDRLYSPLPEERLASAHLHTPAMARLAGGVVDLIFHDVALYRHLRRQYRAGQVVFVVEQGLLSERDFDAVVARMAAEEQEKLYRELPGVIRAVESDAIAAQLLLLRVALRKQLPNDILQAEAKRLCTAVCTPEFGGDLALLGCGLQDVELLETDHQEELLMVFLRFLGESNAETLELCLRWDFVTMSVAQMIKGDALLGELTAMILGRFARGPLDGDDVFLEILAGQVFSHFSAGEEDHIISALQSEGERGQAWAKTLLEQIPSF